MRIEPHPRDHLIGVAVAIVAGLHKAALTGTPVNDDYQHLAYARQILSGDLPLRDFWDISTTLQYGLSAASQLVFGHRLLSEAILVGVCTAVAVFLVFRVLQQVSGSLVIASVCAALFIVAVPRVYGYPKWIVYAVAASLWWNYVWWPSGRKAIAAGLAVAVAFYWRHDHGVLTAGGVALGMLAAHGFTMTAGRRTIMAALAAMLAVIPYLVFAAVSVGLVSQARLELASLTDEQGRTRGDLRWPLRAGADVIRRDPQEAFAPVIGVRWNAEASAAERTATLAEYGLTPIAEDGPQEQRVRLSERSLESLGSLIDDPRVDDTAGVERGSGSLSWAQWPLWDRVRFRVAALRLTVLPGIDQQIVAGAAAAILLYAMPLVAALLAGPTLRGFLPPAVTPRPLLLFAAFAALVNVGLLRDPYELRAAEVIVLPVILFGIFLAVLLGRGYPALVRWPARVVVLVLMLLIAKSFTVAGGFGNVTGSLAGTEGWRELGARLRASPPSQYWKAGTGPVTVRLAEYVRRCTAPSDRILLLWFAPEIHYHADRLMAGRHLYYFASFRSLEDEQRRELEMVTRAAPRIVLASRNGYGAAGAAFPGLVRFVEGNYAPAAAFDEEGDRYSILIRRDSPPPSSDSVSGWPCYSMN